MSILKYALIGAGLAYGIRYITKKRADGSSILDDLTEKAPEWFEQGKDYVEKTINQVKDNIERQSASL